MKVSVLQDELRFAHQEETLLHQEYDKVQRLLISLQNDHDHGPEVNDDMSGSEPDGNDLASEIKRSSSSSSYYNDTSESRFSTALQGTGENLEIVSAPLYAQCEC